MVNAFAHRSFGKEKAFLKIGGMMPNRVKKKNLLEKPCLVCKRPFKWRKKWKRGWDQIKYCSERCRRNR
tara:strand:- start:484 stop:690 length:207 start_codon:yes stop_codon:yes gene_type:complete